MRPVTPPSERTGEMIKLMIELTEAKTRGAAGEDKP
jgi:hypothetical protein